jgi:site-specific recombinase XerD
LSPPVQFYLSPDSQRDATMILLAYRHGLRVAELVGLRWRDVDPDHAKLFVRRLKGSESNAHPLAGDELRALRQVKRDWGDASGFVFMTERGAPMTAAGFRKMLARAGDKSGLGSLVHPHALRHGCGYALIDRGIDVRTVQAWLGHKSITNTVRYTSVSARRFEGIWG